MYADIGDEGTYQSGKRLRSYCVVRLVVLLVMAYVVCNMTIASLTGLNILLILSVSWSYGAPFCASSQVKMS